MSWIAWTRFSIYRKFCWAKIGKRKYKKIQRKYRKIQKIQKIFLKTSILQSVNAFREQQRKKLEENSDKLNLGDVTSINLSKVEGGVQTNVIPSEFVACKY